MGALINGFYVINSDTTKHYGNVSAERMLSKTTKEALPEGVYRTFPWDFELNWNIKDFGPLYIPAKGDKVVFNRINALLYKKIIECEKGDPLKLERDSLWENETYLPAYTFTHNYYFMGGDKVENSQDSRYWGLLPDELIVGKAWLIWKSIDPYSKNMQRKRILKRII